jgi:SAM-dependent methyltransferase
MQDKRILDACCGGRMFWFDRNHPDALYVDSREFEGELCDGRRFAVKPDRIMDFRSLDLPDEAFRLVVFDPPHLLKAGDKGWMAKKYGRLDPKTWREDLRQGFRECFRVLKPEGVLVFKWNENDIPVKDILTLVPVRPLFGHTSGRQSKTHWMVFMKI